MATQAPTPNMPQAHPSSLSDRPILAKVGTVVRARLGADPVANAVPTEQAEIYAVGNFLLPDECARMMAIVDRVARPSSIYEGSEGKDFRTSYSGDVDPNDPFIRMIERRIDDLLGIPPSFGETIQGQRYQPGQQFKAHCDYFHTDQSYWQQERKRGGQRTWTAMAYLNDVEEGGSTDFPLLGLSVPPQAGALLIWNNMDRRGNPNPFTLHAGRPVIEGTKYVITKWYRGKKWS